MNYSESRWRSIIKALTWRFLATLITFTLVWIFTRELTLSLEVGFFDITIKLVVYYFHERGWGSVKWGKKVAILKS